MKCPFCKFELIRGKERQFDTTADHVFDPNFVYERPFRETFICLNESCPCDGEKFWDDYGCFYGRISRKFHGKLITSAIGSNARKFDVECHIRNHKTSWIGELIFWDKSGWEKYRLSSFFASFIVKSGIYSLLGYEI